MEGAKNHRGQLRRLLPLVKPHRRWLVASLTFSALMIASQMAWPKLLQRIIDDAIEAKAPNLLIPYALIAAGVASLGALTGFLRRRCSSQVSMGIEYDMRNR